MDSIRIEWQHEGQTHTHTVTSTEQTCIGRRSDCDIVLPAGTISRRHALLFKEGSVFVIQNISETNPVHFNEHRVMGPGQKTPIKPGDIFRVGPVHFRVAVPPNVKPPQIKIRCSNCQEIVDYHPESFCPSCGIALSSGETVYQQ
jgi:predicted component of type VI protein secretion system